MKLKMTAVDCLIIGQLLPEKGSMLTMMVRDEIVSKCKLSEEVKKKITKKGNKNNFENDEIDMEKALENVIEIDFVDSQIRLLKNQVERLDKEEKINPTILKLCLAIQDAKEENTSKKGK